jgi:hypothetical protein
MMKDFSRDQLVSMLLTIVRNDKTTYEHHEKRRWDGRDPSEDGGTIWLTPREMARNALRLLGEAVPEWGE